MSKTQPQGAFPYNSSGDPNYNTFSSSEPGARSPSNGRVSGSESVCPQRSVTIPTGHGGALPCLGEALRQGTLASAPAPQRSGGRVAQGAGSAYQQNTVRISAIVQSILPATKGLFRKLGFIFGSNEKPSSETCGKIRAIIKCSHDDSHPSYHKHERCNDPDCPVCYVKFASRLAKGVVERVQGYRASFRNPLYHLVFWPDILTGYKDLDAAMTDARRMCKKMGVKAGSIWYHPYRIREEIEGLLRRYKRANGIDQRIGFWQLAHEDVLGLGSLEAYVVYGPHFHAIASGFLVPVKEYQKLGIGGYKKIRVLSKGDPEAERAEIEKVANYISTHACHEAGKQAVRYIGGMSYANLGREFLGEDIVDDVCEICGALLEERVCDDLGSVGGVLHDHKTKKVKRWGYFIRVRQRKLGCKPGGPGQ